MPLKIYWQLFVASEYASEYAVVSALKYDSNNLIKLTLHFCASYQSEVNFEERVEVMWVTTRPLHKFKIISKNHFLIKES